MAVQATRIGLVARRFCRRYQLFFYVAVFLVAFQLFLAYSFYAVNNEEVRKLEQWKSRDEKLEPRYQVGNHQKPQAEANGNADHNGEDRPADNNRLPVEQASHEVVVPNRHNNSLSVVRGGISAGHGAVTAKRKCSLKSQDAKSAYERAQTPECKEEIMTVACLAEQGKLYAAQHLPRYCPLKEEKEGEHLGCYKDDYSVRAVGAHHVEFRDDNNPKKCLHYCYRAGFDYAGVEFGIECWCGFAVNSKQVLPDRVCDMVCPGSKGDKCGGFLAVAVYKTGVGKKANSVAPYVKPEDAPASIGEKVRVAFVLTVTGRALRQVRRLLKALYHTRHFYLIHVDSRQEYLQRELSLIAADHPNIRLSTQRYATIWGGANLLTTLLSCMQELLAFTDWHWDYMLNLSESDYPVKSLEELELFLTINKGKNFVKSHGRDTPRFIKKQGLDHTFLQCDNHMWRLGPRSLPDGIRMDGGSDWVVLNREFCQYVVTADDPLVTGIKQFYKYTLLPAESFFHTVLQNSEYCRTYVNNNLHMVNWRRKQGCKCQHKHLVDWCGCSPNDFLPQDVGKFTAIRDKPTYFARKFEAVINQEVINDLDASLFGSYPEDTPGLASFWHNDYSHTDAATAWDDTAHTFHSAFTRLATGYVSHTSSPGCNFTAGEILEVNHYRADDAFKGLLVLFHVATTPPHVVEVYVQPQRNFQMLHMTGPITRLKHVEVSTNFDPKEEVFRNFGNLLGPYSDLAVKLSWGAGHAFTLTAAFVDPADVVAASYDISIVETEHVKSFKTDFQNPLRPGVWTIKLMESFVVLAEGQFLVAPLSHYGGREIAAAEARVLHAGPPSNIYVENQDFVDLRDRLQLGSSDQAASVAKTNARKSASDLLSWIDGLVSKFWRVADVCVLGQPHATFCRRLPVCERTKWSSRSPDPKSQLSGIDKETGRFIRFIR